MTRTHGSVRGPCNCAWAYSSRTRTSSKWQLWILSCSPKDTWYSSLLLMMSETTEHLKLPEPLLVQFFCFSIHHPLYSKKSQALACVCRWLGFEMCLLRIVI